MARAIIVVRVVTRASMGDENVYSGDDGKINTTLNIRYKIINYVLIIRCCWQFNVICDSCSQLSIG